MLKSILHLLIVVSLLLTPCVHTAEFDGDASGNSLIAMMMTSPCSDGAGDQGKMVQPGHHCWCKHSSFARIETTKHDIELRRGAPFIENDAMKASAVVAPLFKPPSA